MSRESGAALILALMAVVLMTMAVLIVASQFEGHRIPIQHEFRSAVLATLSDAAFAETLAEMTVNPAFTGVAGRDFGLGSIGSTVGAGMGTSRIVTANGFYDGWVAVIIAEVDVSDGPKIVRVSRLQHKVE